MIETLTLFLSWPLRRMATGIAVPVIRLFDSSVTSEFSTVRMGEMRLAITDACSGIEQLFGMLLIGAVIAWVRQRRIGAAAFQYAFILPSIVLSNALRIIVTAAAWRVWGDAALDNGPHIALGWAQTALSLILFAGFGELVARAMAPGEESKGGEEQ